MSESTIAMIVLIAVMAILVADRVRLQLYSSEQLELAHKRYMIERELWSMERKELMDRIQAPSFQEYKSAEIRLTKAQKQEKPEEPVVLL